MCENNIASRSECKALLKTGRVCVNGNSVKDPAFHVKEDSDEISLDGKVIKFERFVYYMLNKPGGIVSATTDNFSQTVIDLFAGENRKGLFPVGRLDKDTEGLLIITDDGNLGHFLTSPKNLVPKEYYAHIKAPLSAADIELIGKGLDIGNGEKSAPAKVKVLSDEEIVITVTEGKFHEVKRILLAVNNEVLYLRRISMNGLKLDDKLKCGEYRRLSDSEVKFLYKSCK